MKNLMLALFTLLSVACGHTHKIEEPETTLKENEHQIGIGSKEVKAGDVIRLYKEVCKKNSSHRGPPQTCSQQTVGGAIIVKILDENSSIVQFGAGIEYSKDLRAEKIK